MSELLKIEVEVSKEAYEVGQAIANLIKAWRDAVADGWQASEDIPPMIGALVKDMGVAVDGMSKIPGEFKDSTAAASRAIANSVCDAIEYAAS